MENKISDVKILLNRKDNENETNNCENLNSNKLLFHDNKPINGSDTDQWSCSTLELQGECE